MKNLFVLPILSAFALISSLFASFGYILLVTFSYRLIPLATAPPANTPVPWMDVFFWGENGYPYEEPPPLTDLLFNNEGVHHHLLSGIYTLLIVFAFFMSLNRVLDTIRRFKLVSTMAKKCLIPYVNKEGVWEINRVVNRAKFSLSLDLSFTHMCFAIYFSVMLCISINLFLEGDLWEGLTFLVLSIFALGFTLALYNSSSDIKTTTTSLSIALIEILTEYALTHVAEGDMKAQKKAIGEQIWQRVRYATQRKILRDKRSRAIRSSIKNYF